MKNREHRSGQTLIRAEHLNNAAALCALAAFALPVFVPFFGWLPAVPGTVFSLAAYYVVVRYSEDVKQRRMSLVTGFANAAAIGIGLTFLLFVIGFQALERRAANHDGAAPQRVERNE